MKTFFFICILIISNLVQTNAQTSLYQDAETQRLLKNISKSARSGKIMFGDANGISMNFKNPLSKTKIEGDCKQILGKDPEFVENDFLFYTEKDFWNQEIQTSKEFIQNGGVVGYCWHLVGPKSKSFRKNDLDDKLVENILTDVNSYEHKWFISLVDSLLTSTFQNYEKPVLFRPFHEMNGNWFWWGSSTITPTQYIDLYRLIVNRLRANGVRNVIYTWSPDTYLKEEYYPGDDYVDLVGLDVYEPGCSPYHGDTTFAKELNKLITFAHKHNKIAVIAETGLREIDGIKNYPNEIPDFWTSKVLSEIVDKRGKGKGIAYVMAWYNADWDKNGEGPAYIPYVDFEKKFGQNGEKAINDFKKFSNHKSMIFNGDFKKNIYK